MSEIDRNALLEVFAEETRERLAAMEHALLALEKNPASEDLVQEIFRAAHTIKGDASCVGFDAVMQVAHRMEDVLDRVRARTLGYSAQVATGLLRDLDALKVEVRRALAGDAPVPAHAESAQKGPRPARASTLRVDIGRLDKLVDLTGEIAIARGRLQQLIESGASRAELLETFREADRLHADLQEVVMQSRMVPLGPTLRQHARTVRDLAAALGKEARLVIEGEDVEIDTSVVEHLRAPLTHMIRNAVDHGLETPGRRLAAGKESCGTIRVRASHDGSSVRIDVLDDGAGIDRTAVLAMAVGRGLVAAEARLTDAQIDALLFLPGFSTAGSVTAHSGRGVGMDVVRRNIEAVHGRVEIASEPGAGTAISIHLPLTLAIIDGFAVSVAGESYIVPLESVLECLAFDGSSGSSGSSEFLGAPRGSSEASELRGTAWGVTMLRGEPLPFLRLRTWFERSDDIQPAGSSVPRFLGPSRSGTAEELRGTRGTRGTGGAGGRENLLVVRHGAGQAGLVVDELLGSQQIVVKPLPRTFERAPGISASAVTGHGRVALILDVATLLRCVESSVEVA
ncbi:MAG TPA: chemotaxis protein CheA [Thermoanaerobaculia bacterium]